MIDVSQRIGGLSPEKRALFELQLMKKAACAPNEQAIARRGTSDPCPLSFAQQRLWFLDQLEPDSPVYKIGKAVRITGRLDLEALQKTIDAVIARHEALRTTFTVVGGEPVRVVAESRGAELKAYLRKKSARLSAMASISWICFSDSPWYTCAANSRSSSGAVSKVVSTVSRTPWALKQATGCLWCPEGIPSSYFVSPSDIPRPSLV
jgi:Condensation domain